MSSPAERIANLRADAGFGHYLMGVGAMLDPENGGELIEGLQNRAFLNDYFKSIKDPAFRLAASGLRIVVLSSMDYNGIKKFPEAVEKYDTLKEFYIEVGERLYDTKPAEVIFNIFPNLPEERYNPLLSQLVFMKLTIATDRLLPRHMILVRQAQHNVAGTS